VHHRYPLHLWKICHKYQEYRLVNFATGTAGVVDTGGKFVTGVVEIMGTISDCLHLKVNLKAKIYLYVNSTTQKC
jgi:hypothetical protein